MFAAEIDRAGDLGTDPLERGEEGEEHPRRADAGVPDVCVRYVRWRASPTALRLLPAARAADLLLYAVQVKGNELRRFLGHILATAFLFSGQLWDEVSARSKRGYRVHKTRLAALSRAAAVQGWEYAHGVRQWLGAATWFGRRALADARFRAERRYRLQRIRVRLLRRAIEGQVLEYVHAATKPALTPVQLRAELDRHEAWVASGWEMGKRADLHQAYLRRANLSCALLADADLHAADLVRADLREADLEGADLHKAKLRRANLNRAELRWADLREADLSHANLEGADLTDADLHQADLRGARLSNAVFEHADLRGANLSRAKGLTQAQINAADSNRLTRLPRGLTIQLPPPAG